MEDWAPFCRVKVTRVTGLLNRQPAWLAPSGAVRSGSLSEAREMLMSPPISVLDALGKQLGHARHAEAELVSDVVVAPIGVGGAGVVLPLPNHAEVVVPRSQVKIEHGIRRRDRSAGGGGVSIGGAMTLGASSGLILGRTGRDGDAEAAVGSPPIRPGAEMRQVRCDSHI